MTDYTLSGFRPAVRPPNAAGGVAFIELYDPAFVWENGSYLTTGGWRAVQPSDLAANVNVSGLSVSVGAVAVTGAALTALTDLRDQGNGWRAVTSSGYVQSFRAFSGACYLSKINGYSKCPQTTNFICLYDATGQVGTPIGSLIVQSGNNFFYELSDTHGVSMANGITIANSSDPFLLQTGSADFVVTVVYRAP